MREIVLSIPTVEPEQNIEIEVLVDNPSVQSRLDQTIHYITEYSKNTEPLEKVTVHS